MLRYRRANRENHKTPCPRLGLNVAKLYARRNRWGQAFFSEKARFLALQTRDLRVPTPNFQLQTLDISLQNCILQPRNKTKRLHIQSFHMQKSEPHTAKPRFALAKANLATAFPEIADAKRMVFRRNYFLAFPTASSRIGHLSLKTGFVSLVSPTTSSNR